MPAQWFIKKDNKWHGPHSFSALKALAEYGEIQRDDLVKDGLEGNPVRVGNINGQTTDAVSSDVGGSLAPQMPPLPNESKEMPSSFPKGMPPLPQPSGVSEIVIPTIPDTSSPLPPEPKQKSTIPELWDPLPAMLLSLVFNFGIGSFVIARNWRTLGEKEREDRCMLWFYGFLIFIASWVANEADNLRMDLLYYIAGVALTGLFYLYEVRPQQDYLRDRFNGHFSRRSWWKPFGVLFAVVGLWIVFFEVVTMFAGE